MAELIVNEQNFSIVFKETLGFVDADFSWKKIKPMLKLATDEMIDLVGEDNYNLAKDAADDDDFKNLLRFPLLMKALIIYLPTGDVTIGSNGRTMRRDDKNVAAFEWQIDKHDSNNEKLYFRGLDSLLKFMFKNGLELNQNRFDYKDLIVNSLALFENHFDIDSSHYLYFKLIPALREAELLEIAPRIDHVLEAEIKAEPKSQIAFLVQKIIVNYAMAWGVKKLNLQLFPKGLLQNESEGAKGNSKKTADASARQGLVIQFSQDYERDLKKLEKEFAKRVTPPVEKDDDNLDFDFDDKDGFVST